MIQLLSWQMPLKSEIFGLKIFKNLEIIDFKIFGFEIF